MLYFRYVIQLSLLLSFSFGGIYNTQTVIPTEKAKAKQRIEQEKERIREEVEKYAEEIEKSNEELKKSIKLIAAVIELKKETLVRLKDISLKSHDTKETKQ